MNKSGLCPHCSKAMFKSRDGKVSIARTTYIAMHKSGEIEIRCDHCKRGVLLPLKVEEGELRKAVPKQKHVIRG